MTLRTPEKPQAAQVVTPSKENKKQLILPIKNFSKIAQPYPKNPKGNSLQYPRKIPSLNPLSTDSPRKPDALHPPKKFSYSIKLESPRRPTDPLSTTKKVQPVSPKPKKKKMDQNSPRTQYKLHNFTDKNSSPGQSQPKR